MIKTIIAVVAITTTMGVYVGSLVKADYSLYIAESACVRQHIIKGAERKNIVTSNGTCYVNRS